MSVVRIASRYAKSLLDLSVERGALEAIHDDMGTLRKALKNRDLALLMKSPIVHADKKVAVVDAIFSGKLNDLTMAYLRLLINKGRESYISDIATEFEHQYKKLKKITSVKVTTAAPMTEEVLDEVKRRILASGVAAPNLEFEVVVNPQLLGGFVLEFDNKRYDASIAHKLHQLKADFSKNLYIREF